MRHIRVTMTTVIAVAEFNQISFSPWWPVGHSVRVPRPRFRGILRAVGVAAFSAVLGLAAGTASAMVENGDSVPRNDLCRCPVTILSNSDQVTVSWQVRSAGGVRLRLYRSEVSGRETLISEVSVPKGVASFEMVDDHRPPGAAIYQIRTVDFGGSERVLGSVVCVESGLSTAIAPISSDSSQLLASSIRYPSIFFAAEGQVVSDDRAAQWRLTLRLDPPVPRSVFRTV